ncbi:MAG: NADH-quinone oxidoreductase subunit N [bacterium]|nr:NADH-quinone oxidoreductase subunit N [bacterium]
MMSIFYTTEFLAIAPIVSIVCGGLLLLGISFFSSETGGKQRARRLLFGSFVCSVSFVFTMSHAFIGDMVGLESGLPINAVISNFLFIDPLNIVFYTLIISGLLCFVFLGDQRLEAQGVKDSIDIEVLMFFAAAGAMVMASAAHLLVLFLGFELLSVCVYALTGTARKERASSEAALKYFVMGAFSSTVMLYGMVLLYGATGSMNLIEISGSIQSALAADGVSKMALAGLGLMLFGLAFKASLAPFHVWAPDAYQGAPTSIAGFMAVVVKVAAFAALIRVLLQGFGEIAGVWQPAIVVLSVLSMTIGNFAALRQKSVKRMLAYSSIAHAGYALMGFLATANGEGVASSVFYLVVYALMTVTSFGVVLLVTAGQDEQYERDTVESFAGLGGREPILALVMTVALFSLAGFPPFAGFIGKLGIFRSAMGAGYTGLVVIAAFNSLVSLYYYLRVVVVMYFGKDKVEALAGKVLRVAPITETFAGRVVVIACALGIVLAGVCSEPLINFTRWAVG